MQFKIGDQVVHPTYGVGTIKAFSRQRFVGETPRPYYEVSNKGATIWVPINEQGSTVLRGIASKNILNSCRRLLQGPPTRLNKNHQLRQHEFAHRLEGGLLPAMCGIVRDLKAESRQKVLGATESELLRKTFKAVCEEWAASDGVTSQSALDEIESLLRETHSTTQTA